MSIERHADHDPSLICRPAFGNGLCEPLSAEQSEYVRQWCAAEIAKAVVVRKATGEPEPQPGDGGFTS